MKNLSIVAVLIAAATAALLVAPPYFGIDTASAGLRHVSIGHRFRWAPPSPEEVCDALRERAQAAPTLPTLTCPPPASRRSDLQARVNTVHLAGDLAALLLVGVAWLAAQKVLMRAGRPGRGRR